MYPMCITNSNTEDIDAIFQIYSAAISYQIEKGYNVWPVFERSFIQKEIEEQRHWKIVKSNAIACVFSVLYTDPIIWGDRDKAPSIYLHRIATHPSFKGRGIIEQIIDWAKEHGRHTNKQFIRMDTWGNNQILTDYYLSKGFEYLGQQYIPKTAHLPEHYWNITVNLFQITLS